ncbi:MAG: thioredoxin domain-containing protein [Sphingomonadales bacterium]
MTEYLDKRISIPTFLLAAVVFAAMALGFATGTALAERAESSEDANKSDGYTDIMLGDPDAPISVIEYASMTCGACAAFHDQVFKDFKKDYIDTGKANFVLRHFVLNGPDLAASMIARCVDDSRYYAFIDLFLDRQSTWITPWQSMQPGADRSIAEMAVEAKMDQFLRPTGMNRSRMTACLDDKKLRDDLLRQRTEGVEKHDISATPTVLINGKPYTGDLTYDAFEKAVKRAM